MTGEGSKEGSVYMKGNSVLCTKSSAEYYGRSLPVLETRSLNRSQVFVGE